MCCFHTCCIDLLVHVYLYEYQLFFNLIYIHVCTISILVAWIYMYVCMNINSFHIALYTYLCCCQTLCIDSHVCSQFSYKLIYIFVLFRYFAWIYMYARTNINSFHMDLYTCLCCLHTFCMHVHICLYGYQ